MRVKKTLKWIAMALLMPFLLIALLAIILYLPPIQNWAVRKVAVYASGRTGMNISVDHVKLLFPLDLGVEGVRVTQPNDSLENVTDTVVDVERVRVEVQLKPLFQKQVMVDECSFDKMRVNTANFIHQARVKGNVGRMSVKAHGVDLSKEFINIDDALLADAKLNIELSDTVSEDTSKSENFWKINVQKLQLKNTDVTLQMPGDTLQVNVLVSKAQANDGFFDLYKGLYQVKTLNWQGGNIKYDNNFKKSIKGLDYNHIALSNVKLKADSVYYCDNKVDVCLKQLSFKEKSGLVLSNLYGRVVMDSTQLQLPDIYLRTPYSDMQATVKVDLNTFDAVNPGILSLLLHGNLGREDVLFFMSDLPKKMQTQWPYYPLSADVSMKGNLQEMNISELKLNLPTVLNASVNGRVANITDMNYLKTNVNFTANTYNLGIITSMLAPSITSMIRIPYGMRMKGNVKSDGAKYAIDATLQEGRGSLKAIASIDTESMTYQAKLQANNIQAKHIFPQQDLYTFTGTVDAKGVGTDFLSSHTQLSAKAKVNYVHYGDYKLDKVLATADVSNGNIHVVIDSDNDMLNGLVTIDALTNSKDIAGTITANLHKADLYKLQVAKVPMAAALCGHVDLKTDLDERFDVQASIGDIQLQTQGKTYHPVDINADVMMRRDTTHAIVNCGDFNLNVDAHGGYKILTKTFTTLSHEVSSQLKNRRIDQTALRRNFPLGHFYLQAGKENFISRYVKYMGYDFKHIEMDIDISPVSGVEGYMNIDSLVAQGVQLDTLRTNIITKGDTIRYSARIQNNKDNPQYVFRAMLNGELQEMGSDIDVRVFDAKDKLGIDVGLAATMKDNGINVSLINNKPILGYKQFIANEDNYLFLGNDMRVSADLELKSVDGMGLKIYTNDENTDALQDITVSMNQFDLEKVLSILPYTPEVSGVMNGDFHAIQTTEAISVSSNLSVDNLVYEKCPMGNLGTEFVYMPKSDGSHYVDGILTYNDEEVAIIQGTYKSEGDGYIDADLGLEHLPLHFINGFVPDQLIGLKGDGDGNLKIKGFLSNPVVDGEIYLDSAYLVSVPYGIELRFDNDPVQITGSKLLFENFNMYANNDSPLTLSGSLDFSDLERMMLNLQMRAQNYLLIDSKENARSEAFGKAYVNFFGMMNGPLTNLTMRGKLDVLGTTDMTYILRDSELTTDTELDELVKFTDFKNQEEIVVQKPSIEGFNMSMSISIDETAHVLCALNADKSNYVDLEGGGDLNMSYNPNDGLQLTGKYTLNNGEMKYSLPIIPLKTFTIEDGSYVEFTGDPFNPTLSITATENIRTTVNEGEGTGRAIDFTCGVKLSQTLEQPGILFIISSPNDLTIQDELNTMSTEEQAKVAITMLASGMYLANGNTSSFSMNSALSSFLNSEINNIAGSAMQSLGLDLGMSVDNTTNASGALHTDYNFQFAKRFWNNRLSVTVGGQVSSGAELENQSNNETFFNNVELQYRLNDGASQYIRAFYNSNTYDWLEGQIGEYGVGFMWKRKLQKFSDIFHLKTERQQTQIPVPAKKDSISVK